MLRHSAGQVVHGISRYLLIAFLGLAGVFVAWPVAADIVLPQADGTRLVLKHPAERIVTLAPNLAELVFAAGAGSKLIGAVEYSNYPPPVTRVPRIGDAFRIDLEHIVQLEPDLVIAWQSGNPPTALQKLEQLGLVVWRIEITHPRQIADSVQHIAMAAGTENHGLAAAAQLRERLESLRRANTGKLPVSYFYQVSQRPLYTVNGSHIISRGLEMCAAHNVFSDLAALAPQISREALIAADPQVMVAPQVEGEPPALENWLDWPNLRAVKNGALVYLPADEISQATPRLLDGLELACKLLDPLRKPVQQMEH
ncbi:MAG: cobalamin-binding protein [Xanthomonadales bacterium]|nr:cobalamin-binding protein [Xanthomonadales bacterium]